MCGITGFVARAGELPAPELEAVVGRMAETLRHRGPDDGGVWADPVAGVALGHRRLAVVDLSPLGHQPMRSACGRYTITYNGELYNHGELRTQLQQRGCRFRGRSDTEVLLAAVSVWGLPHALERCNGMFAFALWDREERRLTLARDRLGEKPLYYGWCDGTFLFASELKALRAHPRFSARIDRDALALYLRLAYIPAPHCIYEGVRKLPAGTLLTVDARNRHATGPPHATGPEEYWSYRATVEHGRNDRFDGPVEQAVDELDALLRDAVDLRAHADVPVGAFLSGGIDSTTVIALLQAQRSGGVRTFTVGLADRAYDESRAAAAVARHLGTDHTEILLEPADALAVIPRLPRLYDEPFADPSQIPSTLVAAAARADVTVAIAGDGGDELFAGYNRYVLSAQLQRWAHRLRPLPRRAAARALLAPSPAAYDALFGVLAPVLPAPLRQRNPGDKLHKLAQLLPLTDPEARYLSLVSQWADPEAVVRAGAEPATVLTDRGRWPRFEEPVEQMMYLDGMTSLPEDMLVKVDRASMAVGLEARLPLLDHRVAAFAWRLPPTWRLRDNQGKWLLRRVLHRYVPRELVERPKMGFDPPIAAWLRGPLREWAEDLLDERRLHQDGWLRAEAVRRTWREHLSGRRNWDYRLWTVLMFATWLQDQESPAPAAR